jgi:hypothetical protein
MDNMISGGIIPAQGTPSSDILLTDYVSRLTREEKVDLAISGLLKKIEAIEREIQQLPEKIASELMKRQNQYGGQVCPAQISGRLQAGNSTG